MTDDLINRAEAMTELQMCAERYIFSHEADGFGTVEWCENLIPVRKAMEILRNLPTVDAVPVVRCRDCIFHKEKRCTVWRERAVIVECYTDDDGFCYLGEPND